MVLSRLVWGSERSVVRGTAARRLSPRNLQLICRLLDGGLWYVEKQMEFLQSRCLPLGELRKQQEQLRTLNQMVLYLRQELASDYYTIRTSMEFAEFSDYLVKPTSDCTVRKEEFLRGSLYSYQFSIMLLLRDSNLSVGLRGFSHLHLQLVTVIFSSRATPRTCKQVQGW